MNKKQRKAVVAFFEISAVAIIIGLVFLGANIIKNRWHKIDFQVTKMVAQEYEDESGYYHVTVDATADTWFYDFNTYKFKLVNGSTGNYIPDNAVETVVISVSRNNTAEFTFSFDTHNLDDIKNYTYQGVKIYINGNSKEGTDIRMFLSEYVDLLEIE